MKVAKPAPADWPVRNSTVTGRYKTNRRPRSRLNTRMHASGVLRAVSWSEPGLPRIAVFGAIGHSPEKPSLLQSYEDHWSKYLPSRACAVHRPRTEPPAFQQAVASIPRGWRPSEKGGTSESLVPWFVSGSKRLPSIACHAGVSGCRAATL